MSSGEQNLITRLRLLPAVLGIGAALLVSGCGAGQITQTDTQVPAINGSSGTIGQIAVSNVQLAFPTGKQYYSRGDSASLTVTISNTGNASDRLASITSPQFASGAQITGDATIPSQHAISASVSKLIPLTSTAVTTTATSTSGTSTSGSASSSSTSSSAGSSSTSGSATSTSATSTSATSTSVTATTTPSAALPVGSIQIVLIGLTMDKLQPGQTVQVTFTFASAGDLTLSVPIAADPSPRDDN